MPLNRPIAGAFDLAMASPGHRIEPRRPAPRLYVAAPQTIAPAGWAALVAALGLADVAAVLLRLPAADERSLINHVKALAPMVQDRGAALLIEGHPDIAVKAGADGA